MRFGAIKNQKSQLRNIAEDCSGAAGLATTDLRGRLARIDPAKLDRVAARGRRARSEVEPMPKKRELLIVAVSHEEQGGATQGGKSLEACEYQVPV